MKVTKINLEGVMFDNGTQVTHKHDQQCCENVYADWEQLRDTDIKDKDFKKIEIEKVKGSGIRLNGYFVPCYDLQNGYYSSNLEIVTTKTIDVSDCAKFEYR